MQLTSTSFLDGEPMPVAHSRDGEGSLPVLVLTDVPEGVPLRSMTLTSRVIAARTGTLTTGSSGIYPPIPMRLPARQTTRV